MDLIIQITPSVVTDNTAGITKSAVMFELERSLLIPEEKKNDKKEEEKKNEK